MKTIGYIITAGHLDIEWYQALSSYRFWTTEALEDLKIAAARDDFVTYVLDGQVYPLEEYLEAAPYDEAAMRELIASGKLTVGPFYTQFDEWLPSAENMIRNCLYGKRKADAYGGWMRAGYLPDNFGHPLQMPQILRGFGIDSLMFMRGMPEIPGGHPDEFIYRGIDGSEVVVSHFRESYSGAFDIFKKKIDPIQPRIVPYYDEYLSFEFHKELAEHDDPQRIATNMIANVHRIRERYPSGVIALIAGYDHLPPQINIGESVKCANEMQDEIEFVMGTAEEYVELVKSRMENPAVYDMELIGSRYQNILLGALSTRSYLKRENFACEALLERYAEPLTAIAARLGYPEKPALLDEAWRYMMINSAHDSIHGSSTDEVHVEMQARFMKTHQIAAGVIHDAMAHLGRQTKRWWKPENRGFLTYAPVITDFAQPAELWLPVGEAGGCVVDAAGNPLPTQVLRHPDVELDAKGRHRNYSNPDYEFKKVLFMHPDVGGDITSYAVEIGRKAEFEPLSGDDSFIENEFVRVDVRNACIHLTDKRSGKTYYNLNLIEEDADAGDAWDYSPAWIPGEVVRSSQFRFESRLVECGCVRAVLELRGEMDLPAKMVGDDRSFERVTMPVTFTVTLWRGVARADVAMTIDNTARDHRIRLRIPANLKTDFVRSQGHLAIIDRPVDRPIPTEKWYQPPTQLLPFREWLAVTDGEAGLAAAFKGMYDYEAVRNPLTGEPDVYVTLLRGVEIMGRANIMQRRVPASKPIPTPGAQCLGVQTMEWSWIPYTASESNKAPFLPLAQSFLYPTVSHAIRSKPVDEQVIAFPANFAWDAANVQYSAFKLANDRDGSILRLYENQGVETTLTLRIDGYSEAWMSDMNEATLDPLPITDGCVTLHFAPYKAVTIKFK